MKGSERHRLKENDLSHVLADFSTMFTEHRGMTGVAAGALALMVVVGGGYWAWTARTESRSQAMYTEAMAIMQSPVEAAKPGAKPAPNTYPDIRARTEAGLAKFIEVANAYPTTRAGIASRYYAAASLAMLGRPAEAATRFQEVVQHAGSTSFYGRVAQLGSIESNVQAKQFDTAVAAAQALVNATTDDAMPRDALLMQLGRVQLAAGKKAEARQTLDKVIAEFPESPYVEEAKQMLATTT